MSSIGDLRSEGYVLFKRRRIQARRKRYSRRRLVYSLVDRCAVAPKVTVTAIDRLNGMASCGEGCGAYLGAVTGQRYRSQRRCAVIESHASRRCMATVRYMSSERDILFE